MTVSSAVQEWSIDELSQLVGLPTRTIREYRTIGLLNPPAKRGRVGVYDSEHRARLELIGRLQARGYSLAGIHDLLEAWSAGETLESLVGDSGLDEMTQVLSDDELIDAAPWLADEPTRAQAVAIDLIHRGSATSWHVRAPSLLALATEAITAGAQPAAAMRAAAALREGARLQAKQLASIFTTELWQGTAPDQLARLARRARVLAARSASTLLVDELGAALQSQAARNNDAGLAEFTKSMRLRPTTHHDHPDNGATTA